MDTNEFGLGCVLEPHPEALLAVGAIGATDLPKAFIVPSFKDFFKVDPPGTVFCLGTYTPRDQKDKPSCVGQSTAIQKSAMEGRELSARDIYAHCKQIDGFGSPTSYGTSFAAAYRVLAETGAALESQVPEPPREMSLVEYVKIQDPIDRSQNKNKDSYYVPRTEIKSALFKTKLPVVSALNWFTDDNNIGVDGMMGMPSGRDVGGHAVACVGWGLRSGKECLIFVNSWGTRFGDHGFFYVPTADVLNRFGNGYVSIDDDSSLARLLANYDGMDVKAQGSPDVYHVSKGLARRYPNELVFWAHGKLFGFDLADINSSDLAALPKGPDMTIDDAPFKTRELVRQIRQFYGKN